jgi:hypothetical protein
LALLLPQKKRAQSGAFAAEMLVRALKVLGYFENAITGTASTRQPLISRAMKAALMAEPNVIGNDEPWNPFIRRTSSTPLGAQPKDRKKMTISAESTAYCGDFRPARVLRWIIAAAVLAAVAAPGSADAAYRARTARAGAYDGVWNVMFATQAGNCSSNSFPFTVTGTRVSSAGGGKVTGGIGRGGSVAVQVSVGASRASGSGRLAGNSGSGRWSGIITGDRCSGSWQATRS